MAERSGQFSITNSEIDYHSRTFGSWSVKMDDIVVIGEFTTGLGPLTDDYFIVFVLRDLSWYESSMYAGNVASVIEGLERRFKTQIDLALSYTTTRKSCILAPSTLRGKPLFSTPFDDGTLITRVMIALGLRDSPVSLHPDVVGYIARLNEIATNTAKKMGQVGTSST